MYYTFSVDIICEDVFKTMPSNIQAIFKAKNEHVFSHVSGMIQIDGKNKIIT